MSKRSIWKLDNVRGSDEGKVQGKGVELIYQVKGEAVRLDTGQGGLNREDQLNARGHILKFIDVYRLIVSTSRPFPLACTGIRGPNLWFRQKGGLGRPAGRMKIVQTIIWQKSSPCQKETFNQFTQLGGIRRQFKLALTPSDIFQISIL